METAAAPEEAEIGMKHRRAEWGQRSGRKHEAAVHEHGLRDLREADRKQTSITALIESEQQMRALRWACHGDSEALCTKCGAVLEAISALLLHSSSDVQKPGCARSKELLADDGFFRDVSGAINDASGLIARMKAELAELASSESDLTHMLFAADAPAEAGNMPEQHAVTGSKDLMEKLKQIVSLRKAAADFECASEESLRNCANKAGDRSCIESNTLLHMLCAQDDALVKVAEHAARHIEAHGDLAIERGDKSLRESGVDGLGEALACFVNAKAAFDEVHGIKVFSGQRPPHLPCPDVSEPPALQTNGEESDALAIAGRLRDLAKKQRELQIQLRGVQRDIQRGTREIQYTQRCHDIRQLVEVQLRLVSADDAAAVARADGVTPTSQRSRDQKDEDVACLLQRWMTEASEQVLTQNILHVRGKLQQEFNRLQLDKKDEIHFLEQLRRSSGDGKGTPRKGSGREKQKVDDGSLRCQFAQFFADELGVIWRRRAMLQETCSAIKLCLKQRFGEDSAQHTAHAMEAPGSPAKARKKSESGAADAAESNAAKLRHAQSSLFLLVQEALDTIHGLQLGTASYPQAFPQQQLHRLSDQSPTTLIVHPAVKVSSAVSRSLSARSIVPGKIGPACVSGVAESASEACVEYLQGVKRLLDRSTHVLLSGEALGLLEFQSLEELARDIDLTNYDGLLRMVLVGLGLRHAVELPAQASVAHLLGHCKSVCRTLDLVLEKKIANAVVLTGSIGVPQSLKTTETGAGDSHADGRAHVSGARQDQNLAETLQSAGRTIVRSNIEMLLSCVCAYARTRYPWLRRIAIVNLADPGTVSNSYQNDDDFLVLQACPLSLSTSAVGVAKDEQPPELVGQGEKAMDISSAKRDVVEALPKVVDEEEGVETSGQIARRKQLQMETQTAEGQTMTGIDAMEVGNESEAKHDLGANAFNSGISVEGDSAPARAGAEVDSKVTAGVDAEGVSVSLKEFRPGFIFVVYDKGSRQKMTASASLGRVKGQKLEQESWERLCSMSGRLVHDAEEICDGNIIFMDASSTASENMGAQGQEWLSHVRTTGSIVEAALGGGCQRQFVSESGGSQESRASFFPWPMPFRGSVMECKDLAVLYNTSNAPVEFNRQEIVFETLCGTRKAAKIDSQEDANEITAMVVSEAPEGLPTDSPGMPQKCTNQFAMESIRKDSGPVLQNLEEQCKTLDATVSSYNQTVLEPSLLVGDEGFLDKKRVRESETASSVGSSSAAEGGFREKKRGRETETILTVGSSQHVESAEGRPLRDMKPRDAAIDVLRGKSDGLQLDEIVNLCQHLPRKLDLGNSLKGTQRMDARSALRHALTAGCSASGERPHRRPAVFALVGDRYHLLQEAVGTSLSQHRGDASGRATTSSGRDSEIKQAQRADAAPVDLGDSRVGGSHSSNKGTGSVCAAPPLLPEKLTGMLLDLADRIPYSAVRESTASVWDNFRTNTQNCKTPSELAQNLLWFSQQILPRVLHSTWSQGIASGKATAGQEAWRDQCGQCKQEADVLAVLKDFECNAVDWNEVSIAFREEWAGTTSKSKSSKFVYCSLFLYAYSPASRLHTLMHAYFWLRISICAGKRKGN